MRTSSCAPVNVTDDTTSIVWLRLRRSPRPNADDCNNLQVRQHPLRPAESSTDRYSPDDFIATATALSLAIRVIGGSIGYSIYFNVFGNKLTTELPAQVAKFAIGAGLPASSAVEFVGTFLTVPANITRVPGVTPAIIAAATKGSQWAYAEALKMVWLVSIPFGVCAIVACCFLGNTSRFMTNRVAAHIKH